MKLTYRSKMAIIASLDMTLRGLERELAASFDVDQQAELINDLAYHKGLRDSIAATEPDLK